MRDVRYLVAMIRLFRRFGTATIRDIDHFSFLTGVGIEGLLRDSVDSFVSLIRDYEPDVVVDFWNPVACIAARACHRPLVTVIQADMHPLSGGFIWWKPRPENLPSPLAAINTVLAERGLRPVGRTGELFVGERTLVVGMPETDPLPETADVTYVGAILWEHERDARPPWFSELRDDAPVVWLYPGTARYFRGSPGWADSLVVATSCIEALRHKPVRVVISTGHRPLPRQVLPLPPNFRHVAFVPGVSMAARSDLMIHHGGYGSCQTGLLAGTPSLVIPTMSERESNARRVAAAGAGEFVLPEIDRSGCRKRVDPVALGTMLDRMLSDSSYRGRAADLSVRLRQYGGSARAAELIDAV